MTASTIDPPSSRRNADNSALNSLRRAEPPGENRPAGAAPINSSASMMEPIAKSSPSIAVLPPPLVSNFSNVLERPIFELSAREREYLPSARISFTPSANRGPTSNRARLAPASGSMADFKSATISAISGTWMSPESPTTSVGIPRSRSDRSISAIYPFARTRTAKVGRGSLARSSQRT